VSFPWQEVAWSRADSRDSHSGGRRFGRASYPGDSARRPSSASGWDTERRWRPWRLRPGSGGVPPP